jgi:hypothetical protein
MMTQSDLFPKKAVAEITASSHERVVRAAQSSISVLQK